MIDKRINYRFGGGYQGGRNTGVSRGGSRSAAMGTGGKQKGGTFSQGTPGGSGGPTSGGGGSQIGMGTAPLPDEQGFSGNVQ